MDEIIKIFKIGYFDAINDIYSGYNNKKIINNFSKEKLSNIYDIGYIFGYNNCIQYIKNNL